MSTETIPFAKMSDVNAEAFDGPEEPFGLNKAQRAGAGWMVIGVDNYNREDHADHIVARDVRGEEVAKKLADALNADEDPTTFYRAVPHDHRLCRGMWDLI